MPFGSQVGSLKTLKQNLKKGTPGPIQYIPKEGSLTVRFLAEPETWIQFRSVYDPIKRKSYPVPEEGMPGYPDPDTRVATRYLAPAVDTEKDKVIALELPKDLTNQLVIRYEKYGTLLDRDYELMRSGEGLDTEYMLTPEPPTKRNVAKYTAPDLEDCLEQAYNAVFGDEDSTPVVRKSTKPTSAAAKRVAKKVAVEEPEEDEEPFDADDAAEDEGDDLFALAEAADAEDDEAATRLTELCDEAGLDPNDFDTWAEVAEALSTEDGDDDAADDDDDDTAVEDDDDADDDDDDVDYEAMSLGELRTLAREAGIVTKGMSKAQVIAKLTAGDDD